MKRIKRASIVLIAVALVVSLTMVLPASAQREKEDVEVLSSEFVLATMDYSGSIDEVQVFNWLSLNGNGTVTVKEEAAFDDISGFQGVKGFAKPSLEGDYIVWPEISVDGPANVIATTKLGESSVEEARMRIPLGVRFKYWFDGEPVTDLETITGKSGRFKMELTLRNESKEMSEIEYKDPATGQMVTERVETYLPMVILPYDWYFDNSIFFNLEADPTGLVVWMPDFYNVGWSIPLFPPATEESHTIWVAADVVDFAMPPLTLAVAFTFPETNQTDPLSMLSQYIKAFYDGMVTVNEGIGSPTTDPSLLFGITAVNDGLTQLAAGLPTAVSNLDTLLIPGAEEAAAGIGSPTTPDTLLYADAAAMAGLQGISAGIGSSASPATLLYAMNAIGGGLQGIQAGIGSSATGGTLLYAVNAVIAGTNDIAAGLQTMMAGLGTVSAPGTILGTLNAIAKSASTSSAPGSSGLFGQTSLAYGTTQALRAALPGLGLTPLQQGTIDGYLANIETALYNAIYSASPPGIGYIDVALNGSIIPGLQGVKGGMQDMLDGIGSEGTPGTALYALSAIYGGLTNIALGIGSAATPDTLLFAVQAVEMGLNGIKGGIGDTGIDGTLLYALAAIQNGLTQLKAGISSGNMDDPGIAEGLMLISAGLGDAITGIGSPETPDTLLYGTDQVASGMTQLKDEGTSALEEGLLAVMTNLSMTNAELEAIAERGEEFDHFLGRAQDADNNVRFVYQSKPTYNYTEGSSTSWIVAIVLSLIIALGLVAGGILLARRSSA